MPIELTLRTDADRHLTVTLDGEPIADPTPLSDLPTVKMACANPFDEGRKLMAALGGHTLQTLLRADPDRLLLLDCDEQAATVPWEFATLLSRSGRTAF